MVPTDSEFVLFISVLAKVNYKLCALFVLSKGSAKMNSVSRFAHLNSL